MFVNYNIAPCLYYILLYYTVLAFFTVHVLFKVKSFF